MILSMILKFCFYFLGFIQLYSPEKNQKPDNWSLNIICFKT